jgi:hydrogenase expression/formation protein HypE
LIAKVLKVSDGIRFMRDPTRGGMATVMAELANGKNYSLMLNEDSIVVHPKVRGFCELLGFDPVYVANEGKVLMIVNGSDADRVLKVMKSDELGRDSAIIGEVTPLYPGKAWMQTGVGGKRILDMLAGEQLPRIC